MIIKKLKLHNFGIYAFDNEFVLNNDKPVVLIGGMNGRGKTTFLEAVLLALYGSNSFAFQESNFRSYSSYLKEHTNITDGTNESFVELEFTINDEGEEITYIVNRSWNLNVKHIKDKVSIVKNGNEDIFLTQNWTMFIESILPSALANFYFFDGEKIAELAEGETSEQMKNSIKALLGINVIDLLENDLGRIIKRLENEKPEDFSGINLDELRDIKEKKEKALKQIDEDINLLQLDLAKTLKKIEKKTEAFNAKGGLIASQSQSLYNERIALNTKLNQIKNDYLEYAAGELPLLMVFNLLSSIKDKAVEEKELRSLNIAISKVEEKLKEYAETDQKKAETIASFIRYMKSEADENKTAEVFNLSDNAFAQNTMLLNGHLKQTAKSYTEEYAIARKTFDRVSEIDNYLSVDIDEKAIQRIYKQICELQNLKTELEVKIEEKKKHRITANGECIAATTEFNRCVDKVISNMERGDDVERILKYALLAQTKSNEFKIALQKAKIKGLADTMTSCYKRILGKKNLISKIRMDPETLDYCYLDNNGNEIQKSRLSAGEKQLMVISMLWALAECSNKMLPVIIDTPLARLDKTHRKAILERYFPNASTQTIILSTDSEIDKESYGIVKPFVSNEFTLVYDDTEKRSHIEEGYFKEVQ